MDRIREKAFSLRKKRAPFEKNKTSQKSSLLEGQSFQGEKGKVIDSLWRQRKRRETDEEFRRPLQWKELSGRHARERRRERERKEKKDEGIFRGKETPTGKRRKVKKEKKERKTSFLFSSPSFRLSPLRPPWCCWCDSWGVCTPELNEKESPASLRK